MYRHRSNISGDTSELTVQLDISRRGWIVSLPISRDAVYDLLVDLGDKIVKVQVKTMCGNSISKVVDRSNEIVCVGRSIKPSSLLFLGDVLRIFIPGLAPPGPPPPIPDVVFEDSDLLVVNKPSGMLVHPSGDLFTWTVITLCKMKYSEHCLDLAHRLDRETSGTLIITKNKKSNAFMKKLYT